MFHIREHIRHHRRIKLERLEAQRLTETIVEHRCETPIFCRVCSIVVKNTHVSHLILRCHTDVKHVPEAVFHIIRCFWDPM